MVKKSVKQERKTLIKKVHQNSSNLEKIKNTFIKHVILKPEFYDVN
jgi:hypothetical protein